MGDWLLEMEGGEDKETLRWALTPSLVQHIGNKSSKVGAKGGWGLMGGRIRGGGCGVLGLKRRGGGLTSIGRVMVEELSFWEQKL